MGIKFNHIFSRIPTTLRQDGMTVRWPLIATIGKFMTVLGEMEVRRQSVCNTNTNSTYMHPTVYNPLGILSSYLIF